MENNSGITPQDAQATQQAQIPQPPPHSRPSEISVLGSMLQDDAALDMALELLDASDFYAPENQDIFRCMRSLAAGGAPVDTVTLVTELDKIGKLRQVGDVAYITDLIMQTPSTANIEHYIKVVSERSTRRRLIRAGNLTAREAQDSSGSVEKMLDDAERRIYDITLKNASDSMKPVSETAGEVFADLGDSKYKRGDILGLPTGFIDLDRKISGLKKADLIIVAGRPAMGKTSFAVNIAQHVALHAGYTVAIFSLEMSREQLIMRMFSTESEINMHNILNRDLQAEQLMHIGERALLPMQESKLYIDDSAGATVPEIRSKCRRLKTRAGLDLVVIDYLQLMSSHKRTDNRQQEISDITRSLKILARELDVPVVLLSQLSRAPESRKDNKDGHRPMLSDLRESGAIEQDADIVMLLYRDQVYNDEADNVAEVIVAKHRNGPTGTVQLCWLGEYTKFKNLAR
ncbi:replicative DNA helicase [Eubacteriales bacterium OttesenSCG-928-K08]|nr:replicative DNA helicase [Eubacteriales bacterium OttesenSCG-928-K08]